MATMAKNIFTAQPIFPILQHFGQQKIGQIFDWVLTHALALCREYTHRYGKFHKSEEILYRCADLRDEYIPAGSLTVPPKCMGLEYKIGESNWDDVVASYRNYYRKGKGYMNKGRGPQWKKIPSRRPQWF